MRPLRYSLVALLLTQGRVVAEPADAPCVYLGIGCTSRDLELPTPLPGPLNVPALPLSPPTRRAGPDGRCCASGEPECCASRNDPRP